MITVTYTLGYNTNSDTGCIMVNTTRAQGFALAPTTHGGIEVKYTNIAKPHWLRDIMAAYRVERWEVSKDVLSWKDNLRWVDANGETQTIEVPATGRWAENFWTLLHMRLRLTQGEMVPK